MNLQTHALIFNARRASLMAVPESAHRCGKSGRSRGTRRRASTLEGENVALVSGRDTVIRAATLLADRDISVLAGRNIDVLAVANTNEQETHFKSSSSNTSLAGDIFGKSTIYGKNSASQDNDGQAVTQNTAILSANAGDLTLMAGLDSQYKGTGQGHLITRGADLLAGQSIALSGNAVDLQAAADSMSSHSLTKSKSIAIGAQPAGLLGSVINLIGDSIKRAHESDNDRFAGALALKSGYDA